MQKEWRIAPENASSREIPDTFLQSNRYQGLGISLFEIAPYLAISFGGYEYLKERLPRNQVDPAASGSRPSGLPGYELRLIFYRLFYRILPCFWGLILGLLFWQRR